MGRKKIGLTSGLNPLPALKIKSCLIGVGAKLDLPVEVVESNVELPLDAPTPCIALADRKITALIALDIFSVKAVKPRCWLTLRVNLFLMS